MTSGDEPDGGAEGGRTGCGLPGCEAGEWCYDADTGQFAECGAGEGEGEGPEACVNHCDCPEQGWVCMDNECLSPDDAGWTRLCCSKLPCPSGDFCEDDNGNGGNCP